jgi:hypothetical protein
MVSFGFIITRHVNSEKTNKYWNRSVKCLQVLYPFIKIVIIDDNSDYNYVKADYDYKNIEIIQSEFKGRGELLPYYYYIKNNYFDNAVIIHDSVFFHKKVNFGKLLDINVIPLWHFNMDTENLQNTLRISNHLSNSFAVRENININNNFLGFSQICNGCFGVQSFINRNFLLHLERKYKLSNLIKAVVCRKDRCSLERIFGCIFFLENTKIHNVKSLFGNIMSYQRWGYSYEDYENDLKNNRIPKAVLKIWTGR